MPLIPSICMGALSGVRDQDGPEAEAIGPSSCGGARAPPGDCGLRLIRCSALVHCRVIPRVLFLSTNTPRPVSRSGFVFCLGCLCGQLCRHHCFNRLLKPGPFHPSILSFTLLRIPFVLMRCHSKQCTTATSPRACGLEQTVPCFGMWCFRGRSPAPVPSRFLSFSVY